MKNRLTKCLVLSALAIGMSSNVMAEELVVKSSHAPKLTPIAFEVNEGDNKATAFLLSGKKGDLNGTLCYTSVAQTEMAADCHRVTGNISRYGGSHHIELSGNEIKGSKLYVTSAHIKVPFPNIGLHTEAEMAVSTSAAGVAQDLNHTVGGPAFQIDMAYANGLMTSSKLTQPLLYTPPAKDSCFPSTACQPICTIQTCPPTI
jgi:hypothetical protein